MAFAATDDPAEVGPVDLALLITKTYQTGESRVLVRCVILWGRRGNWGFVSHGEEVFCGTFKAGK